MFTTADCRKLEKHLPDLLLDPAMLHSGNDSAVPATLRAHLAACPACAARLAGLQAELRATMGLLDEWNVPEVSPYFDAKLAARLRAEKEAAPAGFFERLQTRLIFGNVFGNMAGSGMQWKSVAAVAALAVVIGGGSYAGFEQLHQPPAPPAVSATVNDLQILDRNDQVISQLDVLDDGNDAGTATQN